MRQMTLEVLLAFNRHSQIDDANRDNADVVYVHDRQAAGLESCLYRCCIGRVLVSRSVTHCRIHGFQSAHLHFNVLQHHIHTHIVVIAEEK